MQSYTSRTDDNMTKTKALQQHQYNTSATARRILILIALISIILDLIVAGFTFAPPDALGLPAFSGSASAAEPAIFQSPQFQGYHDGADC
jgi:hypothetical protein